MLCVFQVLKDNCTVVVLNTGEVMVLTVCHIIVVSVDHLTCFWCLAAVSYLLVHHFISIFVEHFQLLLIENKVDTCFSTQIASN